MKRSVQTKSKCGEREKKAKENKISKKELIYQHRVYSNLQNSIWKWDTSSAQWRTTAMDSFPVDRWFSPYFILLCVILFYHFFLFNHFSSLDISFQIWFKKEMCHHQSFKKKISLDAKSKLPCIFIPKIESIVLKSFKFTLNYCFSLSFHEHELMTRWTGCKCAKYCGD